MAEGPSGSHELSAHNYEVCDVNQPLRCNTCWKYKSELDEKVVELTTAWKIIQLLQEDLNMVKNLTPPSTSYKRGNLHVNNVTNGK